MLGRIEFLSRGGGGKFAAHAPTSLPPNPPLDVCTVNKMKFNKTFYTKYTGLPGLPGLDNYNEMDGMKTEFVQHRKYYIYMKMYQGKGNVARDPKQD